MSEILNTSEGKITITISREVHGELAKRGSKQETFDSIIRRLLGMEEQKA